MNWVWFYFKGTEQENESTGLFGKLPSDAIKAEKSNVDKKLEIDQFSLILQLQNLFEKHTRIGWVITMIFQHFFIAWSSCKWLVNVTRLEGDHLAL